MAINGGWYIITKAPLVCGEKSTTGPNPTDRAKCGTKRSLIVDDGQGIPIYLL
jgi:hypothetical protein